MTACLKVPRLFGLVADVAVDALIGSIIVGYDDVAVLQSLTLGHEFRLVNLREHLDVVATGTIAFRHRSIDVRALVIDTIGQSHLGQQLMEGALGVIP